MKYFTKQCVLLLIISLCTTFYYLQSTTWSVVIEKEIHIERLTRAVEQLHYLHQLAMSDNKSTYPPQLNLYFWPSFLEFFPHLTSSSSSSMQPVYHTPMNVTRKKMVLAVPAVERSQQNYLLNTLTSLLNKMDPSNRDDIVITVMLAESPDSIFVTKTVKEIINTFPNETSSGFVEIISPPSHWYPPSLNELPITFNDSPERMHWRTKQNLDYIFLMNHGRQRAEYYLQLEDDLEALKDYTKTIFDYLKLKQDSEWFSLEFSSLGCIGKLFRSQDLNEVILALASNYRRKPVDWIIDDLHKNRYCSPEWTIKKCNNELNQRRIRFYPVQFQHVGVYSSLKGKIQSLKEKTFRKSNFLHDRSNPPALLSTNMSSVNRFTLQNAYTKFAFFWVKNPQKGDFAKIAFTSTVNLKGLLFSTGTEDHPEDKFGPETTVGIRRFGEFEYKIIGRFDDAGKFFYNMQVEVDELCITVNESLDHWVLMDQLFVNPFS